MFLVPVLKVLAVPVKTEAAALAFGRGPVSRGEARSFGWTFRRNSHTARKADVFSSYRHAAEQAGPITLQPKWTILFYTSEDEPEVCPMALILP